MQRLTLRKPLPSSQFAAWMVRKGAVFDLSRAPPKPAAFFCSRPVPDARIGLKRPLKKGEAAVLCRALGERTWKRFWRPEARKKGAWLSAIAPDGVGGPSCLAKITMGSNERIPDMPVLRIVDNRVFILGLDELYRDRMKKHEREELLACARKVSTTLKTAPADVPIEGYYAEDLLLTEYFQLMRPLQAVSENRISEVEHLQAYRRLDEVTCAPIFGSPVRDRKLLSVGRDPPSRALAQSMPDWALDRLVTLAHDLARDSDDISLVGVAALTKDAVPLAAVRESVVLYAEMMIGAIGRPEQEEFDWRVDQSVSERAKRFIDAFRKLFVDELPEPDPNNAKWYWRAYRKQNVLGRCVCLGLNDFAKPIQYYHWAIRQDNREFTVHEFWSPEVWTTDRYRRTNHATGHRPAPRSRGGAAADPFGEP